MKENMRKLNKIYLYRDVVFRLSHQRNGIAAVECKPSEKDKEILVEFTDLSAVWHDAKVDKQPQKVCGNNPVLVVGLRKGRISYRYLWTDMEDLWEDLELLTPSVGGKKLYDKVMWAYLKDIVPYLKNEF